MKSPKHIICTMLCFGLFYFSYGQNLLSNWSFEDTLSCPSNQGQIEKAIGWTRATVIGSSDYYNTCASSYSLGINNVLGTQIPKTGNAYAGLYTFESGNYREYIQTRLSDSLQPNKAYCVSFYTSLAEQMKYNCNNMGVYFSADSIYSSDTMLTYPSQVNNDFSNSLNDKNNWTLITDTFTATGGEKYLIIGNFDLPQNLDTTYIGASGGLINGAYYYIDDVSVEEVVLVNAGNDTSIVSADSVQLGNNSTENAIYLWQPALGLSDVNAANPMVWVANTTTYVVTKTQCSIVTTDTVTVYNTVGINEFSYEYKMHLYPNPNNGNFTITHNLNEENYVLEIVDVTGKVVHKENITTAKQTINTEQLSKGLYLVHLKTSTSKLIYVTKMSVIH